MSKGWSVHSTVEVCLNYGQHNESLKCERLKAQKIRRRPESCHGFHPEVSPRTAHVLFTPVLRPKNLVLVKELELKSLLVRKQSLSGKSKKNIQGGS